MWTTLRHLLPAQARRGKGSDWLEHACSFTWEVQEVATDWGMHACSGRRGIRQPWLGHALAPMESPSSAHRGRGWQEEATDWGACAHSSIRGTRWQHLGHSHLLCWESLPVPTEAGAGMWGEKPQWQPRPLHTTQQWHLTSKAVRDSSRSILSCRASHSHSLRLTPWANSSPLPGSTLLTACFSTQPHQHWWTPVSGWGMQSYGTDNPCKSQSVLPATEQPLHFLPIAPEGPSISVYFATGEGPSLGTVTSPLLQLPPGLQVPSRFLFSFSSLFLFHPTWLCRDLFLSF